MIGLGDRPAGGPAAGPAGALAALALALLTSACATTSGSNAPAVDRGRSGVMVTGGESGLGISGAETPPALKVVAAAPYALPAAVDCAALGREIASLDELLGPDVDILVDPKIGAGLDDRAGRAFGSAVRGFIPYRWALRWMTQAGDLDQQLRQAVLAGSARRGFLKGMRLAMACPVHVPPTPALPAIGSREAARAGPGAPPPALQPALAESAERKEQSSPR